MDFQLIRSKRKTLSVSIDNTGKVIVKAPLYLSLDKINTFLVKKSNWIKKHQSKAQYLYQKYNNLYTYDELMYKGLILKCTFSNDVKHISINESILFIPKKYQSLNNPNILKNALKKFLILEAQKEFNQKLSRFENLGFVYNSLKITNPKSRWGSCDLNGNIAINFRAIMLPPICIDYLIIHELAHTIQFNHSKDYWEIVRKFIPNYKEVRKELKNYNFLQALFR